MKLAPLTPSSHDLVLGVPRSGKTTLARKLVARERRCWFFDPTRHDYTDEGEVCRVDDLEHDPYLTDGVFSRVVIHPGDDVAEDFRRVLQVARKVGRRRPLVLVADELVNFASRTVEELTQLHCNGHHDGVRSLLVAHFAVLVPKTCRRSATRVLSLLQDLPDDLDALRDAYGEDFAATVAAWKPGDPPAVWTRRTLYPAPRRQAA